MLRRLVGGLLAIVLVGYFKCGVIFKEGFYKVVFLRG